MILKSVSTTMPVQVRAAAIAVVDREDFEEAVSEVFDVHYAESEGPRDFRIDFGGDTSVWMRGGRIVEGNLPKRMRLKMDAVVKKLGLQNEIAYD